MSFFNAVKCALIEFANMLIEHVLNNFLSMIALIIGLLPSLPLPQNNLVWGDFGRSIGYFIPLGTMAQHFTLMLALMIIWYSYEYIMRLIKMIK